MLYSANGSKRRYSQVTVVLRFEGRRLPKSKLKRPTVLVVDDDSPVLQDCLRRWQNVNRWIRFGKVERFAGVSFPF